MAHLQQDENPPDAVPVPASGELTHGGYSIANETSQDIDGTANEKTSQDIEGTASEKTSQGIEGIANEKTSQDIEMSLGQASPASEQQQLPAAPPVTMSFPDGGWEAWSVVVGSTLVFTAGVGYINSFSVFQSYYSRVVLVGHSQDAIAWIGSIQLWGAFGFGIPAGLLLDLYGPKVPLLASAFFIVFGTMMSSISTKYWHFLLSQGLCSAFGFGLSFTPALAAPQQWFLKQRALATGLAVSGTSLGGIIWPVLINRLLNYDGVGLGWTLRTVGFLQLAIMLVAACMIKTRVPRRQSKGLPLGMWFRQSSMVVLAFGLTVLFFALYVPYFYITPYAMRWGASAQAAFYYPSIMNGVSFFGRFFCGIIADRYLGHYNTLILVILITGIISLCWIPAHDNAGNIVWSCFYGFFSGALQSLFTPVAAKLAPSPQLISAWVGIGVTIIAFGALGSQPVAGRLLDSHNDTNYVPMQVYTGVMILSSALPVTVSRLLHNRTALKL
ncbi:MFS general substrate transporter [Tilletiaria anomala UBC 951]|uniref:MFS general substrate transporter n=1 Tax=Tilletiaria anomala (strain ATCC 24038 / CBS 436.72 / UBC 951) TaxID=1037660 RepID=A0A066VD52_TILAU|nr:MFS general substrate transporter [Tilletiaria anomala UBC 951]KDN39682.1 MFS general substrate transporter [Tilletiaria anomala UBC 951]